MIRFGRLVDGNCETMPQEVEWNGRIYVGFGKDFAELVGYKEVVAEPYPQDGMEYDPIYTEMDTEILQGWKSITQ